MSTRKLSDRRLATMHLEYSARSRKEWRFPSTHLKTGADTSTRAATDRPPRSQIESYPGVYIHGLWLEGACQGLSLPSNVV
jgi:hypothetical protein